MFYKMNRLGSKKFELTKFVKYIRTVLNLDEHPWDDIPDELISEIIEKRIDKNIPKLPCPYDNKSDFVLSSDLFEKKK
jgi:hypothetical protein